MTRSRPTGADREDSSMMQRICQDCHKQYLPKTLMGGMLTRNYKKCPYCASEKTAVIAGKMTTVPQMGRTGPPTSAGFNHNNKKPPTH